MKDVLPLFIMVDACGWEILRGRPFLNELAPSRFRLESVFGYSSTCVPSILSGRWPSEHRNWCYFVYDPQKSPFKFLRPLRWLPQAITSRRIFRRWLSKLTKRKLNFRGYFDLYNIPFKDIWLYDFTEKKSPLKAGGMNRGPNIFDFLQMREIPYFVSDPDCTEEENLHSLTREVRAGNIDFAFMYWPGLDGLLHRVGNQSDEIQKKLQSYEEWITGLYRQALSRYRQVHLYVFSDHGMANCEEHLDLRARIEALGLKTGIDYAAVYDSTMGRFWFFNAEAERKIREVLQQVPEGRVIPNEELQELKAYFPDGYFGQLIFLVREGVLIVPSHMGERPIRAMHGYHPSEKHSYAALLTNQASLPAAVSAIPDIYQLMVKEAEIAEEANQQRPEAPAGPAGKAARELAETP